MCTACTKGSYEPAAVYKAAGIPKGTALVPMPSTMANTNTRSHYLATNHSYPDVHHDGEEATVCTWRFLPVMLTVLTTRIYQSFFAVSSVSQKTNLGLHLPMPLTRASENLGVFRSVKTA